MADIREVKVTMGHPEEGPELVRDLAEGAIKEVADDGGKIESAVIITVYQKDGETLFHVTASGFKSGFDLAETVTQVAMGMIKN